MIAAKYELRLANSVFGAASCAWSAVLEVSAIASDQSQDIFGVSYFKYSGKV
jgi:hypothetical protein